MEGGGSAMHGVAKWCRSTVVAVVVTGVLAISSAGAAAAVGAVPGVDGGELGGTDKLPPWCDSEPDPDRVGAAGGVELPLVIGSGVAPTVEDGPPAEECPPLPANRSPWCAWLGVFCPVKP